MDQQPQPRRLDDFWYRRRCVLCDTLFGANRRHAVFCSAKCRKKASRFNKKHFQTTKSTEPSE